MIDAEYEKHLIDAWEWSERIAKKCTNSTDYNNTPIVISIFEKISTPYYIFTRR